MPRPVENNYPKHQKWRFLQRSINTEELIKFANNIVKYHGQAIDPNLPSILNFTGTKPDDLKHTWLSIWVNLMHQMGLGYTWDKGKKLYATNLAVFLTETDRVSAFFYYWGLKFQYPFSFPKQKHYIDNDVAIQPIVLILQYFVELFEITGNRKEVFLTGEELTRFLMKSTDHSQVQSNCELILEDRKQNKNYTMEEQDERGFREAYRHFFIRGRLFLMGLGFFEFSGKKIMPSKDVSMEQIQVYLSYRKKPIIFSENTQDMRNFYFEQAYNNLEPSPSELLSNVQNLVPASKESLPFKVFPKNGPSQSVKGNVVKNPKDLAGKFTRQLTLSRTFQGDLREDLLTMYSNKCCICDIDDKDFLITSHIIPVSVDPNISADRRNAVLLCLLHDKALELGYIGISDDFRVLINEDLASDLTHPTLVNEILGRKGSKLKLPSSYPPLIEYLRRHRNLHNL